MTDVEFLIQQCDTACDSIPNQDAMIEWSQLPYLKAPLLRDEFNACTVPLQVTIRIVDTQEMAALNKSYRNKDNPTNVLSFPFDLPKELPITLLSEPILGDVVLCAPVIEQEAIEQHKPLQAHWAHMLIHGNLHLMGYDHIEKTEADIMETHEVNLLSRIGFDNPYHPLRPPSKSTIQSS